MYCFDLIESVEVFLVFFLGKKVGRSSGHFGSLKQVFFLARIVKKVKVVLCFLDSRHTGQSNRKKLHQI